MHSFIDVRLDATQVVYPPLSVNRIVSRAMIEFTVPDSLVATAATEDHAKPRLSLRPTGELSGHGRRLSEPRSYWKSLVSRLLHGDSDRLRPTPEDGSGPFNRPHLDAIFGDFHFEVRGYAPQRCLPGWGRSRNPMGPFTFWKLRAFILWGFRARAAGFLLIRPRNKMRKDH